MASDLHAALEDASVLVTSGRELAAVERLVAAHVRVTFAPGHGSLARVELDARRRRGIRVEASSRSASGALRDAVLQMRGRCPQPAAENGPPPVHLSNANWNACCAPSAEVAASAVTVDPSLVTCAACRALIPARAEGA